MYKSARFCSLLRRSILDKREIHTTKKVPAKILQIHRKHSKNKFYKRWIVVCKAEGDSGYKTVILPCPKGKSRGALPDLEDQVPIKATPKFPDFGTHPTRTYPPKLPKEPEPEEEKDCTNFPGEPVLGDKPKKKDKQKKKKKAEQKFKIIPCPNYVKGKGALPSSFEEQGFRLCPFSFTSPEPSGSKGTPKAKAEPKKVVLEIVEKRPPVKTASLPTKTAAAESPPQLEPVQTANDYNPLDVKIEEASEPSLEPDTTQMKVELNLPQKQVSAPSAKKKIVIELVDHPQEVTVRKPPKFTVFNITKSIYKEGSKLLKKQLESKKVAKPPHAAADNKETSVAPIPPKPVESVTDQIISQTTLTKSVADVKEKEAAVVDQKRIQMKPPKLSAFDVSKIVSKVLSKESVQKQELETVTKATKTVTNDKKIVDVTAKETAETKPPKLTVSGVSKSISKALSKVSLRQQISETVLKPSKATVDKNKIEPIPKPVEAVAKEKTDETKPTELSGLDVSKSVIDPLYKKSLQKEKTVVKLSETVIDNKGIETTTKPVETTKDEKTVKAKSPKFSVFDVSKSVTKALSKVSLRKEKKEIVPESLKAPTDDKVVEVASKSPEPAVDVTDKKTDKTVSAKLAVFDVSKSVTEPHLKKSLPKQEIESKDSQSIADDKETEVASKSAKPIEAVTDQESDKVKPPKLSVFNVSKSVTKALSKVSLRKEKKEIVQEPPKASTDDKVIDVASKSPESVVDVTDKKIDKTVSAKPAVFDVSKSHLKESLPKQEIKSKPSQSIADDKETEVASKSAKPIEAVTDQESDKVKPPKLSVFNVSKSVTKALSKMSLRQEKKEIVPEPSETATDDKKIDVASKSPESVVDVTDKKTSETASAKPAVFDVSKSVTEPHLKESLPKQEIESKPSQSIADDKGTEVASKSAKPIEAVTDQESGKVKPPKLSVFNVSKSVTKALSKVSLRQQKKEIVPEPSKDPVDDKEVDVASKSPESVVDVTGKKTGETVSARPAVFDVSKSVSEPHLKESLPKQKIEIVIESKPSQSIADDKETEVASKSAKHIELVADQESGRVKPPKLSVFNVSKSVTKALSKMSLRQQKKEIVPEPSETATNDKKIDVASTSPESVVDVTDKKTGETASAKPAVFDVSKSVTKPHLKESLPKQEIEIESKPSQSIADDKETEFASKSTKPIEAVADQESGRVKPPKLTVFNVSKSVTKALSKMSLRQQKKEIVPEPSETVTDDKERDFGSKSPESVVDVADKKTSERVFAKPTVFDVSKSVTESHLKESHQKEEIEMESKPSESIADDKETEVASKSAKPIEAVADQERGKVKRPKLSVFDFSKSSAKSHLNEAVPKVEIEIESKPSESIADDKEAETASKSTKPDEAVTDHKTAKAKPPKLSVFNVSKSVAKALSKVSRQPQALKIVPKPSEAITDDKETEMASKPPKPVVIDRASTETKPPKLSVFDISKSITKAIRKVTLQQPEPKDGHISPKPVAVSHKRGTTKPSKDDNADTGTPELAAETKPQKLSVFDISKSIMKPRFKISVQQQEPKRVPTPSEVSNVQHKDIEDASDAKPEETEAKKPKKLSSFGISKTITKARSKLAISNIPKTSINKNPRLTVFKNRKRSIKVKKLSHKKSQKSVTLPSAVEVPKPKSDAEEPKIYKEDEIYKLPRDKKPKDISQDKLESTAPKIVSVEHEEGKKHVIVEFAKCATCHIKPSDISVSDTSTKINKAKLVYFKKYSEKSQKAGGTKPDVKEKPISKSEPKVKSNVEPVAKPVKVKPLVYDPKKRFGRFRDLSAKRASNDKPSPIPVSIIKQSREDDENQYKSGITPKFLINIKSKPVSYIKHKHEDDGKLASATNIKPDPTDSEYAAIPVSNVTPPHTVNISTTSSSDGTPEYVKHVVHAKKVPEDGATPPSGGNKKPKPLANIPSKKKRNKKDDASNPLGKFKVKPVSGGKRKHKPIEFTEECDPPCPPRDVQYKSTIAQSDGLDDNKPVPTLLVGKPSKNVKSRKIRKLRNIFNTDAAYKWFARRRKRRSGGGGKSGDGSASSGKPSSGGGSDSGPTSSGPSQSGAAPTMPSGLPGPPIQRNLPNPISASTVFSVTIPTPNCSENSKISETLKEQLQDPMKKDEKVFFTFKPIYTSAIDKIEHSRSIDDPIDKPDIIDTSEGSVVEYKEIIKSNSLNDIALTVPEVSDMNKKPVIQRDTIETTIAYKIQTDSKEKYDDKVLYNSSASNYSTGSNLSKGNGQFKSQIKATTTFGKQMTYNINTTGDSACGENAIKVPPCDNVFKDSCEDKKDEKPEIAIPPCENVFVDEGKCAQAASAVDQCSAAPSVSAPCAAAPSVSAPCAADPSATATSVASTTATAVVMSSPTSPADKAKTVSTSSGTPPPAGTPGTPPPGATPGTPPPAGTPGTPPPAGTPGTPPPSTAVSALCRAATNFAKKACAPPKAKAVSATKAPVKAKAPPPAKAKTPPTVKAKAPPPVKAKAPPPVKAKAPPPVKAKATPPVKAKLPAKIRTPLTRGKVATPKTASAKLAKPPAKVPPVPAKAAPTPDKASSPPTAMPSSPSAAPPPSPAAAPAPGHCPVHCPTPPAPAPGRCPVHCPTPPAATPPAPPAAKPPEPCTSCPPPPAAKPPEPCKPSPAPPAPAPGPCPVHCPPPPAATPPAPPAAKPPEPCKPCPPPPVAKPPEPCPPPPAAKPPEPCPPPPSAKPPEPCPPPPPAAKPPETCKPCPPPPAEKPPEPCKPSPPPPPGPCPVHCPPPAAPEKYCDPNKLTITNIKCPLKKEACPAPSPPPPAPAPAPGRCPVHCPTPPAATPPAPPAAKPPEPCKSCPPPPAAKPLEPCKLSPPPPAPAPAPGPCPVHCPPPPAVKPPAPCPPPTAAKPPEPCKPSPPTPTPAPGRCPVHCPPPAAAKPPEPSKPCPPPPAAKPPEPCKPSPPPPAPAPGPCPVHCPPPAAAKPPEPSKPCPPPPAVKPPAPCPSPPAAKPPEPSKPCPPPPAAKPPEPCKPCPPLSIPAVKPPAPCPSPPAAKPPEPCKPSPPPPAPAAAPGRCPVHCPPPPAAKPPEPSKPSPPAVKPPAPCPPPPAAKPPEPCKPSPPPPAPAAAPGRCPVHCPPPPAAKPPEPAAKPTPKPPEPCKPCPPPPAPAKPASACKLLPSAPPPSPPAPAKPEAPACKPEPCKAGGDDKSNSDKAYKVPPCEKPFKT